METFVFMVFGLGFFLFAVYVCVHDNRQQQIRQDRRDDIEYNRTLNERREFGYETVEEAIRNKPKRGLFS